MIRVAIVAPILAVRAGLRTLVSSLGPAGLPEGGAIEVAFEAPNLADLEPVVSDIDVLILVSESGDRGELFKIASERTGQLAILLLSDLPQDGQPLARLPLRAWGILSLDSTSEELMAAIQALYYGLWVGAPALVQPSIVRFLNSDREPIESQADDLTERETEVLQLLARGLANKQIAVNLGISEHTVKFHVSSIYAKLNTANRTETVRVGMQRGLVLL